MNRPSVTLLAGLLILAFALGALLGGGPRRALAQEPAKPAAEPAVDIKALTQPPAVVAAVPLQSRTDYEQDPFDTQRLRRTQTTVQRLLLIHADGSMEAKDAP